MENESSVVISSFEECEVMNGPYCLKNKQKENLFLNKTL